MKRAAILLLLTLSIVVTGCGGSKNSNGSQQAASSSGVVAKVEHATAKLDGGSIVATAKVTVGGKAGEHLALRYGLVDAVSGVRASQEERLAARYTTTAAVEKKDISIRFPKPETPTDYLLHFVIYAPDGSYLASADSPVFTVR